MTAVPGDRPESAGQALAVPRADRSTAVAIVLMIATLVAYAGVLQCGFVSFDDPLYVSQNAHVLAGVSPSGWAYAWTTWDFANWHPLTWLSLELDGSVWHNNPAGYHATNLLLHVLNVVLLFRLLNWMTDNIGLRACVAAFFALHPLHVESVAWISERKDVLSTCFLLLTVIAYFRFASRPAIGRYLLVVVLHALGLLSKPMLVTLPILLLLLDGWPLNRIRSRMSTDRTTGIPWRSPGMVVIEKVPLLLLSLIDGLVTVAAQRNAAAMLADLSFADRTANMFHAFGWYLVKTFVPLHLAAFYPHPERSQSWVLICTGAAAVIAISLYAIWNARKRPYLFVGWLWFVISLLPVIGLLQVGSQAYADRYSYIPHIGLLISIAFLIHEWCSEFRFGQILCRSVAVTLLLICGFLASLQVGVWKSSETLWEHAIKVDPANYVAHFHRADQLQEERQYARALDHLNAGLKTRRGRTSANAHFDAGRCLVALNQPAEAERQFLDALELDAHHPGSLEDLAKLLRKQGRQAEAAEYSARYGSAVTQRAKARPTDGPTQLKYGLLLARQGRIPEAIATFETVVGLIPSAAAHNNLGLALEQMNRRSEAKSNYLRAVQLNPQMAVAHFNLAKCLLAERDVAGAKLHFEAALRLNPDDAEARQYLQSLMH